MHRADHLFVITGGPGSGKTTLIDALEKAGFACSHEAGRAIIQDQQAIDGPGLPWRNAALFAELMLAWEMRSFDMARELRGPVFCDRGVPDVLGYLRLTDLPVPAHVERAAADLRYNPRVFIAPPWRQIFETDEERRQSFDEAVRTYEAMVATYEGLGYALIELPRCRVRERLAFVRAMAAD
jgi:predicted ATPase